MIALLLAAPAAAVSLSLQSESTPWPGVTLQEYRATSPGADVFVARIDLCANGIHVDATKSDAGGVTTGTWASGMGMQVATNGDFYTSGPEIYGDAVGSGIPWPLGQTGLDSDSTGEWYYQRYGWIAFLADQVTYTHSELVKEERSPTTGWAPSTVAPDPPPGTLALVSGFPEIVIDGEPVTCSSPTSSDCFTDRSDMRSRHPRTAMGLTEDLQTFLLVVVDGRTDDNTGMYGTELADTLHQLGAWVAFNLDGGGSSQLWTSSGSYLNDVSGNNYGSGTRSVGNHWGVFAGSSSGRPTRPGHCSASPPCQELPREGGVIDDASDCFQAFGDPDYWRDESDGYDGRLYWTNAWQTDVPDNWAWWLVHPSVAGTYQVEVYLDPDWAVYEDTRYTLLADGAEHEVVVDQGAADGWTVLGSFDFAAGGGQHVAVWDDSAGSVASSQHVVADAIRLTCLSGECAEEPGDGGASDGGASDGGASDGGASDGGASDGGAGDGGSGDAGEVGDGGTTEDTGPEEATGSRSSDAGGCGCSGGPAGGAGLLAWAVVGVVARRRQARRSARPAG